MMRKLVKAVVCSFLLVGLTACVSDSSADGSKAQPDTQIEQNVDNQPDTQNAQDEYIEAFIERYNAYIESINAPGRSLVHMPYLSMDNFDELTEEQVGQDYKKYRVCEFDSGSYITFIIEGTSKNLRQGFEYAALF